MTNKRIVYKNLDGSIGIIIPSDKALLEMTIEDIALKDVPDGLTYHITDVSNIPDDRTFREAWTDDNLGETVDVDMVKARVIQMDRIRALRAEKFIEMGFPTKLNSELEAATISQATRDALQALRDIPQTYDLSIATTPEELKYRIPDEVK